MNDDDACDNRTQPLPIPPRGRPNLEPSSDVGRDLVRDGVADESASFIAGYYAKASMNNSLRVDRGDAKQTRRHQGVRN
jgi:hypothetical protein